MPINRMRRNGAGTKRLQRCLAIQTREDAMIAALSTIAVLGLLWFLTIIGLAMLEESGGKILAALQGRSPLAVAPAIQPISWKVSPRARAARPMRARPILRAAA